MQVPHGSKKGHWFSYFIVYDYDGVIVGKFSFFSSMIKFLSENQGKRFSYREFQ